MEFDKSRVYTALNADELKVGSKVICAIDIATLKQRVKNEESITDLQQIMPEEYKERFHADELFYPIVYLVSEPKENRLKWTDLNIGDVIKHRELGTIGMVVGINPSEDSNYHIFVMDFWLDAEELLKHWEKVEVPTEPRPTEPRPIVFDQPGVYK